MVWLQTIGGSFRTRSDGKSGRLERAARQLGCSRSGFANRSAEVDREGLVANILRHKMQSPFARENPPAKVIRQPQPTTKASSPPTNLMQARTANLDLSVWSS